jgi:AraC family transcriptional regulator, arabinose operon regulatory protein
MKRFAKEKGEGFPGQRIVVLPRAVIARAMEHPVLSRLLPTDVGYFPKADGHLRERPSGTDQAIYIYCTQGEGWCDMAGRHHPVRAGDLLVVPPLAPHAYGAGKLHPWTIHWFHVTGTHGPFFLEELGATIEQPVLRLGEAPGLLALFEEVLDVVEHGYAPSQLLHASQALAHLLAALIRQHREHGRGEPDVNQKIAQSVAYMKQHLQKPLRVGTLASLVSLSSSHYSALFKSRTGYAPMDYFMRLRMHRACQLLDTTGLSVKEIALELGYEDPLYFSRVFKAVNDLPPSDYRRTHKG